MSSTTPTGSGLAPNVAAALSYAFGLLSGVVFLLIEKDKDVRFHAMQSIFVSVAWTAVWVALSIVMAVFQMVPGLHLLFALLQAAASAALGLGGIALWVLLMVRAYQGQQWKLPYIGELAERYAASMKS